MTRHDYRDALQRLGLDHNAAARLLRCIARSSRRYASGERPIPGPVAELLKRELEARAGKNSVICNENSHLSLAAIRMDDRAQPRAAVMEDRVAEYAEEMGRGDRFPLLVVFQDTAHRYWLADGFHRYHAAVSLGLKTLECIVHQGELRDAVLFSCGANATHGVRRSN